MFKGQVRGLVAKGRMVVDREDRIMKVLELCRLVEIASNTKSDNTPAALSKYKNNTLVPYDRQKC